VSSRSFTLPLPCVEFVIREWFEEGVRHDDQSLESSRTALRGVIGNRNQTRDGHLPARDHDIITGVRTLNQMRKRRLCRVDGHLHMTILANVIS